MSPKQSLKSLLRTPFKTILTFLLIAAASFALFSRVSDYAVTSREMNTIISHYYGVVALNNGVPDTSSRFHKSRMTPTFETSPWYHISLPPTNLTPEQIETFSSLLGITLAEIRYMTGGVINEHERFYRWEGLDWGFNYNARYIVEGTFAGVAIQEPGNSLFDVYNLYFEDSKVLAGNFPLSEVSGQSAEHYPVPDNYSSFTGDVFHIPHYPNSHATTEQGAAFQIAQDPDDMYFKNSPFNLDFIENLKVGSRYVLIGRYSTLFPESWIFLGDYDTHEYFPSFAELDGQPENYLELEEFSRLKDLIDITNNDLHTFDIVYSTDMRAIPRVNEQSMEIYEGRFLTTEDTQNNALVCVVSHSLSVKNNLNIGDKLTIELGDRLFMQHAGMGAVTYIPERAWNTVETIEVEIVGVYIDTDTPYERQASQYWSYHPCTIFVPMSLLPIEIPADHKVWAGEFSVLIENPMAIDKFLEVARPLISEWELERVWENEHGSGSMVIPVELRFSDRGWSLVKNSINTSETTSLVTTMSFVLGAALALLLAVYLYIGRNKKTYAIIRALGVPKRKSANSLAMPFVVLSVLAIPIGGITGLVYTSRTVTTMLEDLSTTIENYTVNVSIPIGIIVLCLFGTLGFITLLTALFLWRIGKIPPLELLQGDVIKINTVHNIPIVLQDEPVPIISFSPIPKTGLPEYGKYSAFRQVSTYILKHMSRLKWKTAISLTLAIVLTGAIGFITVTGLFYKDLFNEVDVNCTSTNFSTSSIKTLSESELTENLYYFSNYVVFFGDTGFAYNLILTNDFERCIQNAFGGEYTLNFAEGYFDTSFFAVDNLLNEDNKLCIIGSDFGVKAGESIMVMGSDKFLNLSSQYTDERLSEAVAREAAIYKVAAVVDSNNKDIRERIFAPVGANAIYANNGEHFPLEYSEFTLTDNEKTVELLTLLNELREDSRAYSVAAVYSADTTELDNIRRVRDLLILLFPIALAGAVLIGLTAPGLIIIQSAKEAAILRVLGVTKKRARCMLMFEQIGLCVVGIALAAGGLVLYNSGLFTRSAETLAVCGVLYLLGCVCATFGASVSVTRRRILELLQVKE
ncbi:MAG: hypothetical protein FWD34_07310 [Oscillospiraceae bacterium]|nr:hypothetical protein [Oscillospiraceae bacterium]